MKNGSPSPSLNFIFHRMSDLLNNATRQQPFDGDPCNVASDYLDKLFYLIPSYEGFRLIDIINKSDLTPSQKNIADYVHSEMEHILRNESCLEAHSYYGNLTLQLNSHGRDVRTSGGLVAYKRQKKKTEISSSITNISNATLKNGTLKKVFSNPWVITVIGGLLILFLAKLFGLV